jgi:hypothetical protein
MLYSILYYLMEVAELGFQDDDFNRKLDEIGSIRASVSLKKSSKISKIYFHHPVLEFFLFFLKMFLIVMAPLLIIGVIIIEE